MIAIPSMISDLNRSILSSEFSIEHSLFLQYPDVHSFLLLQVSPKALLPWHTTSSVQRP